MAYQRPVIATSIGASKSRTDAIKFSRREFLAATAGAAALPTFSRFACAQTYPTRPVHLIVGFPAGGVSDIIARLTAQWLSERLDQPFVVENRPGAGANVATEIVARARPDGYTLLQAQGSNGWNATLYDNLNFVFVRDITPVASVARTPAVLEVNPAVPVKTVAEFIGYAKANPGIINLAAIGQGSAPQLYGELFKMMTGIDLPEVQYRNSGPYTDLVAGRVQAIFDPIASSMGYIKAGQLRPLGVTTATRIQALPNVPPIGDIVPGYEASGWQGLGAPATTPPEIIAVLNKQIVAALADGAFRTRLLDLGMEPFETTPAEFGNFITEQTEKWAKVIKTANIKPE
jgi:tripartite-type tricarboxylate transporter receptor subunit TctC